MGEFMKKKSMWVIGILVAILFIAVVVVAVNIIFYPSGSGLYGDRLDGIENYAISDEKIEEVKSIASENKECKNISYTLQGKIMKFFIEVSSDTGITSAQRIGDNIIDGFSETELGYYDVAIYVTSTEKSEQYPMMGYKSKNESAISWTINKGEVKNEE